MEAALEAVASEEATALTTSRDAARDAISMVQAALGRRDSAAYELESSRSDPCENSDPSAGDISASVVGVATTDEAGHESTRQKSSDMDDEPTTEPESARRTRNNPVASHSHLAHLLW